MKNYLEQNKAETKAMEDFSVSFGNNVAELTKEVESVVEKLGLKPLDTDTKRVKAFKKQMLKKVDSALRSFKRILGSTVEADETAVEETPTEAQAE